MSNCISRLCATIVSAPKALSACLARNLAASEDPVDSSEHSVTRERPDASEYMDAWLSLRSSAIEFEKRVGDGADHCGREPIGREKLSGKSTSS